LLHGQDLRPCGVLANDRCGCCELLLTRCVRWSPDRFRRSSTTSSPPGPFCNSNLQFKSKNKENYQCCSHPQQSEHYSQARHCGTCSGSRFTSWEKSSKGGKLLEAHTCSLHGNRRIFVSCSRQLSGTRCRISFNVRLGGCLPVRSASVIRGDSFAQSKIRLTYR